MIMLFNMLFIRVAESPQSLTPRREGEGGGWQGKGEKPAHLMFVLCHTELQVAAAAQALQTLAAAARSCRGRWRKMSASTSSGSSPGWTIAAWGLHCSQQFLPGDRGTSLGSGRPEC